MTAAAALPVPQGLDRAAADAIVAEAARGYFDACRARVPDFVDRTFSFPALRGFMHTRWAGTC